jgi:hypothetical protein
MVGRSPDTVRQDIAYLGGERTGGKRGRGAPGKTPFVAAVETTPAGKPVRLKLRRVDGFSIKALFAFARRCLGPGSTVVSDGLRCFVGVTDAGCTHQPMTTGGGPAAVQKPAFKWVNTALGNVKVAISADREVEHPISHQRGFRGLLQVDGYVGENAASPA